MPNLLDDLNPQQRAAVEHVGGPLLVLAGAGSGKTRVITYRIANLIQTLRVEPWRILAVTFTNKAAEQMQKRVARLLADVPGGSSNPNGSRPFISTFHSFAVRVLRQHIDRLDYPRGFAIYDEDDQLRQVKACLEAHGVSQSALTPRSALSRISYWKNQGVGQEDLEDSQNPSQQELAEVYGAYQARLRASGALDFDDLLLKTVELFDEYPEVAETYRRRFLYLHVDEYQDTNRPQYRLIRQLTLTRHNICAVGDEDQSIYRWRGATIENILNFERDFPETRLVRLEQNYRSTQVILEAANGVVSRNRARKGKTLWTERTSGPPVGLLRAGTAEEEAAFIAQEVKALLDSNAQATVGVLYRTNAQSRLPEEALRALGVRYRVVGGFSFYARAEIRDVLAYARLVMNGRDSAALLRVINMPPRGLGAAAMAQLESVAAESRLTLWEALEELVANSGPSPKGAARALAGFERLILTLEEDQRRLGLSEFFRSILDRTRYLEVLEAQNTVDAEGRIENLRELVNAAAAAQEAGDDLATFLDRAALTSDTDDYDERSRVSLMTLHSAKGLEFSAVFLAGLEENLLPHRMSVEDPAALEEERRLCYVGMTRARDRLVLSCAATRRSWGEKTRALSKPSRFLSEIPPEAVERLGLSGAIKQTWTGSLNSRQAVEGFLKTRTEARGIATGETDSPWKRGSRVRHAKYGWGVILASEGEGDDLRLTVSFPGYGAKKLIPRFANMERV